MAEKTCPSCGYEKNDAQALSCNLCGGVLGTAGKLPNATATAGRDRLRTTRFQATTRLDQNIAKARQTGRMQVPREDPKAMGLRRLEEAKTRVTQKLQKLSEVQADAIPILQAQIQAEKDEKELAKEIELMQLQMSNDAEELKAAEAGVRQLRKQLAALRFEARQSMDERLVVLREQDGLQEQMDRLIRLRERVEQGLEDEEAPSQAAEMEIKGLQTVCQRLSERVTILKMQLTERDTYLHWVALLDEATTDAQRAAVLAELEAELEGEAESGDDDAVDAVHWLRSAAAEAPAGEPAAVEGSDEPAASGSPEGST